MSSSTLLALAVVLLALTLWASRGRARRQAASPPRVRQRRDTTVDDGLGVIEIEDVIDLHGFRPREIPSVVESYLEAATERGFTEVRLIHGRGKGVQRRRVRELLARHPLVERFRDAPAHRGGWGATIAWLRTAPTGTERREPPGTSRAMVVPCVLARSSCC
jgi:DNA-nicking Smr family endonuclease